MTEIASTRLTMARRLVVEAIGRYESALAACRDVDEATPPRPDGLIGSTLRESDDPEALEYCQWYDLASDAGEAFDLAELALATLIEHQFDSLGGVPPEARDRVSGELAVRHRGSVYTLVYEVAEHEPGTNIIAVTRDANVLALDEPARPSLRMVEPRDLMLG